MREIKTAGNLTADVEGDIEDIDGVLRITRIRLRYRFKAPQAQRATIDRVLGVYAEKCPAYQSVKGCIECTWELDLQPE